MRRAHYVFRHIFNTRLPVPSSYRHIGPPPVADGLRAGAPAFTGSMACASGLQAIRSAARVVRDGEAYVMLAGGTESMSRVPYLLDRARRGYRLGHGELIDAMYRDGVLCPLSGKIM